MPNRNLYLARIMVQEMSFCLIEYLEDKLDPITEKEIIDPHNKIHLVTFSKSNNQKNLPAVRSLLANLRAQYEFIVKNESKGSDVGEQVLIAVKALSDTRTGSKKLDAKLHHAVNHAEMILQEQEDERDFSGKKTIDPI